MIKDKLMQKVGIATQTLAAHLIKFQDNDRLPTVSELSEKFDLSRGTIQGAMSILKDTEAIVLNPKGHLGTFIQQINYVKLLDIVGIKSIVGVMPLPYSKRYEGLATGICSTLAKSGFNSNFAFMRGSNNRLKGLLEGRYDFAVVSKLSADFYINSGENIRVIKNFGDLSYVNKHIILTLHNYSGDFKNINVGIDNSSVDQKLLTEQFFNDKNCSYIPVLYHQIVSYLSSRVIDAAVWNLDDIDLHQNKLKGTLLDEKINNVEDTQAVIICKKENELIFELLYKFLDDKSVLKYQKAVIYNEILPNY